MKDNRGEKMPLYEGKDGKLYYNFAIGLKVQMHGSDCDKNEDYTYELVGCHYIGTTEYYDVEINGVPLPQPNSANRVKYLISRYGLRTLNSGERQELPLTVEEVKAYFNHLESRREYYQKKASELTEYCGTIAALRCMDVDKGLEMARGNDEAAAALDARIEELKSKAEDELRAHGIAPEDIAEPERCPECGGRGYVYNHICACAIPHTQAIKDFNAKRRLKLSKILRG